MKNMNICRLWYTIQGYNANGRIITVSCVQFRQSKSVCELHPANRLHLYSILEYRAPNHAKLSTASSTYTLLITLRSTPIKRHYLCYTSYSYYVELKTSLHPIQPTACQDVGVPEGLKLNKEPLWPHVPVRINKRKFKPKIPANRRSRRKITQ
ncbi:hypothetical protein BDB01DRAFT_901199 [Pilobolus umbonatus]|nr:hypothetical protein BDB01DRAFT_901199 [Pilobolus umbonatus]